MRTPFPIPGGWSAQPLQLAGRQFELLLPANPDQVLTEQLESEANGRQGAADPYWAALWSSATPTAEFVLRRTWPAQTKAIELGCGVGLVGLAAAACGVDVVLSDYMAEALQIASENLRRNGLQAGSLLLDWSQGVPAAHRHVYTAVLASDVLYSRDNHLPLLSTIDQLLAPHGTCWIGDPGRYNSREFLAVAAQRFRVHLEDQQGRRFAVPTAGHYQRFVLSR